MPERPEPAAEERVDHLARGDERVDHLARGDEPMDHVARGYARGRARDEALRAGLTPLAPGERPLGLKLAVALALLLALANAVALAAGVEGSVDRRAGVAFVLVMLVAAAGMWAKRYWAVLAFEILLTVSLIYASLSLAFASNVAAALLSLAVIALAAPVFWLLIRIMARLQLPSR